MSHASHGRMLCTLILMMIVLGGSGRSVRAAPGSASHRVVYAAFDGVIYVSIDQGLSWMAIDGAHLPKGGVSSLAVDGGAGSTLYANDGNDIYRSGDAGQSWSLSLAGGYAEATAPAAAGLAYALIHPESNTAAVMARTTDGGVHWSRTALPSTVDSSDAPSVITVDPGHPSTLVLQGSGAATLLSNDGGHTWRQLDVSNLVWDPASADVAYAMGNAGSFEKSTDRGAHWRPLSFSGSVFTLLAAVPGQTTSLLSTGDAPPGASFGSDLYRADERHPRWRPVLPDKIDVVVADPLTPGLVLASGESALYRSTDGGAHWTTLQAPFSPYVHGNGFELIAVSGLAVGPRPISASDPLPQDLLRSAAPAYMPVRGVLYYGMANADIDFHSTVDQVAGTMSGTGCGALPSNDTVPAIVVDPRNASTIYAGTSNDLYVSTDGCTTWRLSAGAPSGSISALAIDPASGALYAAVLPNRLWIGAGESWQQRTLPVHTQITSLIALPGARTTLLVGTLAGVFATTDGGATWLGAPQLHAGVDALAVDPTAPYAAWAVGDSGVSHTADAGKSWQSMRLPALSASGSPATVAANGRGTVLVGDSASNIYQSPDRGHTWTGTPADSAACSSQSCNPISAMGFDPTNPDHALAIVASGSSYESYDGGATWNYFHGRGGAFIGGGFFDCLVASPHAPLPVDPVASQAAPAPGTRYVPTTRHTIGAPFLSFYDKNGGLRLFGLPLTEAYTEDGQTVQVFERARLMASAGGVTISPLGAWLTVGQAFPTSGPPNGTPPGAYFAQTRQVVSGRFWPFYQAHHGTVLLGAPISGLVQVQAPDGSGHSYLAQWFENGRLEYHPELAGTPFVVSLGLVGVEFLRLRNWL